MSDDFSEFSCETAASAYNCLVVCGPTASGKTALGVQLALDLGGEILSADSRQVYRGMDIGTGKDLHEYATPRGSVRYHLMDIVDPTEIYSVFDYQRDAYRLFRELSSRRCLPVLVGGTGLYIEAVVRTFNIPDVPADRVFRDTMMERSLEDLVEDLKRRSPERHGSTVLSCKRRVVRALEVVHYTERFGPPPVNETDFEFRPLALLVSWPREELRERVRRRLLERLEAGMVEEVRILLGQKIPGWRYDLFGMEYKHVARYLRGEVSRDGMIDDLHRDIMYLARRQETYFRGMKKRGIELHTIERASLDQARGILGRSRFLASG